MAVFQDAALCRLVDVSEVLTASIIKSPRLHDATSQITVIFIVTALRTSHLLHLPDEGGSKNLWKVGHFLRDYTARCRRRQQFSVLSQITPALLVQAIFCWKGPSVHVKARSPSVYIECVWCGGLLLTAVLTKRLQNLFPSPHTASGWSDRGGWGWRDMKPARPCVVRTMVMAVQSLLQMQYFILICLWSI